MDSGRFCIKTSPCLFWSGVVLACLCFGCARAVSGPDSIVSSREGNILLQTATRGLLLESARGYDRSVDPAGLIVSAVDGLGAPRAPGRR